MEISKVNWIANELKVMHPDNKTGLLNLAIKVVFDNNVVNDKIKEEFNKKAAEFIILDKEFSYEALKMHVFKNVPIELQKLILEKEKEFIKTKKKIEEKKQKKEQKASEKEVEREEVRKRFYDDNKFLYEEIYDGEFKFVKYDPENDSWEFIKEIVLEDATIKPIEGEEVPMGVVKLPKTIKKYNSLKELDEQISSFVYKWLDVEDKFRQLAIYSARFSWVYDKFNTLNYLRALGDTGSGKSRFLDTIGAIHYTPMMVSGALSPASIFRLIHKWKGTLLIDEGDQKNSDEADSFIKIMNCGYEKDRSVMRCNQLDANKLDFFDVYCPKVITTRRRFEDKATEARCLTQIMVQTSRTDIFEILTKQFYEEAEDIRSQLLYYRLSSYRTIDSESGLKVNLNNYEPRLRQISRSFISLFQNEPEQMIEFKKFMDRYQKDIIDERAETFEGMIIRAIAGLICNDYEIITPQMVADYINDNLDPTYDAKSRSIGHKVKPMGLVFDRQKIKGVTYNKLQLENIGLFSVLFQRYISDGDLLEKLGEKGYEVTKVTLHTNIYEITKFIPKSSLFINSPKIDKNREFFLQMYVANVTNVTNVTEKKEKNTLISYGNNENNSLRISTILNFIEKEDKGEGVSKKVIIDNFGTDKLFELMSSGDVYEPRAGFVRRF